MAALDNYKLKKTIGTGAFSKVKLAEDDNGNQFALKITRRNPKDKSTKHWDLFYNEVNSLKRLDHPNIIKCHNHSEDSVATRGDGSKVEVIYMALDLVEGGEIFDYIAETGKFSEPEARYYFHQLIECLEYIHNKGYAHRDIKPENILLDSDFNIKLCDFGFATKEKTSTSRKGTFGYMSPEVLSNQEYNCVDADLFGSAVVLFILATQHPPFLKADPNDKYYKKIYDGNWEKFWSIHSDEGLSSSFIDMMSKMLSVSPKDRLSLKQIKEHEWYNGPMPSPQEIKSSFTKRKEGMGKKSEKPKQAKSSTTTAVRADKKLTQFYDVNDGDQLLNILMEFAENNHIKVEKSKEYFRAQLVIEEMGKETGVLVSVLKKPDSTKRCLEFKKLDGDLSSFEKTFEDFTKYLA